MSNFNKIGVDSLVTEAIASLGISEPTNIQSQAIPIALSGKDILASSQTGTGKTLAFIAPLLCHLLADKSRHALVLTPTREIAIQIEQLVKKLKQIVPIRYALLIGGEPMGRQLQQMRFAPQLVIATPGRLNDHMRRQSVNLSSTCFVVLDEIDRMLDMGFTDQIEAIMKSLPKDRQTLMFSATVPHNIEKLLQRYLRSPERITVGEVNTPIGKIEQDFVQVSHAEKFDHLVKELDRRDGSIIVFVKTKMDCEEIKDKLLSHDFQVEALHGDLRQRKRERVIQLFRQDKVRIVIATDIASRGLDVPHIRHVINYDLPQCPEDYIHRIGRTGRAGAEGSSLCLLTPSDKRKWMAIAQLIKVDIKIDFPRGAAGGGDRKENRRSFGPSSFAKGPSAGRRPFPGRSPGEGGFRGPAPSRDGRYEPRDRYENRDSRGESKPFERREGPDKRFAGKSDYPRDGFSSGHKTDKVVGLNSYRGYGKPGARPMARPGPGGSKVGGPFKPRRRAAP